MLRTSLLAASAIMLAACATQETQTASATSTGRDCFRSNHIDDYDVIDDQHIRVESGNKFYIITVRANARDVQAPDPMIINAHDGWICTGNGLGLNLSASNPLRPLFIESIERAPPEPPPANG